MLEFWLDLVHPIVKQIRVYQLELARLIVRPILENLLISNFKII